MTYVYGGGAILLALAVIAGGGFLYRSINQRRAHNELMEAEAARKVARAEANGKWVAKSNFQCSKIEAIPRVDSPVEVAMKWPKSQV